MNGATFVDVADCAVLVGFGTEIGEDAHGRVLALDRAIAAAMPAGVIETVPALVNLLVRFDPVVTDHVAVRAAVHALVTRMEVAALAGIERRVQVCYDAAFGPDLEAVAKAAGLSEEAVINAHLAGDYQVLMYGFSPGYAYLAGVPEAVQVPRKQAPVRGVAAGSVIIAGPQCLVTTLVMPTGWSILGRSPTRVLTGDAARPFLFDVGDHVVFERVDLAAFERLEREAAYG